MARTNADGRSVARIHLMMSPRIVSLLPSATEIVAALGFAEQLVGRSHECDFPPGVEKLPGCSSTKVSGRGSSIAGRSPDRQFEKPSCCHPRKSANSEVAPHGRRDRMAGAVDGRRQLDA